MLEKIFVAVASVFMVIVSGTMALWGVANRLHKYLPVVPAVEPLDCLVIWVSLLMITYGAAKWIYMLKGN